MNLTAYRERHTPLNPTGNWPQSPELLVPLLTASQRREYAALVTTWFAAVGPENLRRLIMLKIFFRTAILRPYEAHFIFRDRFPDGRLPLPTFPTA